MAGIFLVLFAFGITPRLTWHNLVANHKDGSIRSTSHDPFSKHLSKAGFNCQCDNTIIESPFVSEGASAYVTLSSSFKAYTDTYAEAVFSSQKYCSSLRGPPSC